jgi:anti-sigma factor RsiW
MNCNSVQHRLSAFVDGELAGREMLAVREHVRCCTSCSREVDDLVAVKRALASGPIAPIAGDLEARLLSAIGKVEHARRVRRPVFAYGFATFALFAIVGFSWFKANKIQADEARALKQIESFEVARDQAYVAGSDPLGGDVGVLTVSFGQR